MAKLLATTAQPENFGVTTLAGLTDVTPGTGILHRAAGGQSTFSNVLIEEVTDLQATLDTKATVTDLTTHTSNTANPHVTTAFQVGAYTTAQVDTLLVAKAPLASPALTGTPTTPTAANGTNNTQIASCAFTVNAIANVRGAANGIASLDGSGLVPSAQLPSYVDDVLEFANLAALPGTGETGKIYVTLDTNLTYRWSGSVYVRIDPSPGSTDSVPEGSVNLYWTNARFDTRFGATNVADNQLSSNVPLKNRANTFTVAPQTINIDNADHVGIVIKEAASQTANPFEIRNSSGSLLTSFDRFGNLNCETVLCSLVEATDYNIVNDLDLSGLSIVNANAVNASSIVVLNIGEAGQGTISLNDAGNFTFDHGITFSTGTTTLTDGNLNYSGDTSFTFTALGGDSISFGGGNVSFGDAGGATVSLGGGTATIEDATGSSISMDGGGDMTITAGGSVSFQMGGGFFLITAPNGLQIDTSGSDVDFVGNPIGGIGSLTTNSGGSIGFNGVDAVAQGASIANATTAIDVITRVNLLLAYLRARGDIAA